VSSWATRSSTTGTRTTVSALARTTSAVEREPLAPRSDTVCS
jgi:hypothetical protein